MNFAEAAIRNAAFTRTENGAVALNTTGDARLDFFGTVGSLRGADKCCTRTASSGSSRTEHEIERITRLFSEAYKVDPLFATKIVFYARDIRGGLGERKTFRTLVQFMAKYHPEALRPNLDLLREDVPELQKARLPDPEHHLLERGQPSRCFPR